MASPTIKSEQNTSSSTAATAQTVQLPPAIVNGDTVVIFLFSRTNQQATTSSGFTLVDATTGSGTTDCRVECWIKDCTSAEQGTTVTFNRSSQSRPWAAYAAACDPLNLDPAFIEVAKSTDGGSHPVTVPDLTALGECLSFAAFGANGGSSYAAPGTWAEEFDVDSAGASNQINGVVGSQAVASAGTVTGGNWNRANATNTAISCGTMQVALLSESANVPPTATAVEPVVLAQVGQEVEIAATADDPDGTIASWDATHQTAKSTTVTAPALTNNADGTFTFTPTVPGVYVWEIVATDNGGAESAPAEVAVMVAPIHGLKVRENGGEWRTAPLKQRSSGTWA
jgi:hypothetical protein